MKNSFQMGQMGTGNLACAGKFTQESIDRGHMERGNEVFQLWKKDVDQAGNGLLQLSPLLYFIKSVSGE